MSLARAVSEFERELLNALKTGKVILGTRKTLKLLKLGRLKAVVVAANAPPEVKQEILYYASLGDIPVYVYPGTSVELGAACGKPFTVMSLGIVDEGQSRIVDLIRQYASQAK
ncbi:ribosomal protein L7Ae/L30e/S12e/Gadd45 [Pyrolobus fumarii 1A]|uniref:Large ribosomal subunit protein eL30 n=1 Tax=Pyrolobus fumarii (strain DSM 11204 / 1A) TaxID=694429 RepID=G0EEY1_PYRF1|nr:50S ribosomal protein L30e [Pyrolobus fumarii]AEM38095.1 ribosomal protein L7Ae/L30e/S12e/Gadd45 [Pyrolobus fumarii 1A]